MKFPRLLFCLSVLLVCPALFAFAADDTNTLTPAEIIRHAQSAYAQLTSYRDAGKSVTTMGSLTAASFNFTIQLARTNLYKVVWWQGEESFTPKGAVWSTGHDNLFWMSVLGSTARKQPSRELALASATGVSGGAAASIPGTFFKSNWGGLLTTGTKAARLADDKIGETDCYVLKSDTNGRTNTLWIGKADFLIRQVENDINGILLKQMMEEQAKSHPQIRASLDAAGDQLFQDTCMVETHSDIKINEPLTAADFDFQIPVAKP
jgi:hypothetical protein